MRQLARHTNIPSKMTESNKLSEPMTESSGATCTSSDAACVNMSLTGSLTGPDLEKARAKLDRLLSNDFFRTKEPRRLPKFDASEIGTGPQLGVGGFGVVSEVECINLKARDGSKNEQMDGAAESTNKNDDDGDSKEAHHRRTTDTTEPESTTEELLDACAQRKQILDLGEAAASAATSTSNDEDGGLCLSEHGLVKNDHRFEYSFSSVPTKPDEARVFLAENTLRDGHARYAIKRLKPDLSEKDRKDAVMDMAIEAKFLAVISHPNIVKMRGTASTDSLRYDYFIVMDRLYGTLDERIDEWLEQEKEMAGSCCGLWGSDEGRLTEIRLERITALYDVSKAMEYLHENNIIYRDIKPENIGFDIRGDVKVFDFGLSRVLQKKDQLEDGTYKLTACSGSLRYMAPEVVLSKPYNLAADVFSFATLSWQILELKVPFESLSAMRYIEVVCKDGWRPPFSTKWPAFLRSVLKDSWNANLAERPDFTRLANVTRGVMKQIAESDRADIHNRSLHMIDRSNRSLHSRIRRMRSNSRGTESSMDHSHSNHFRRDRREAADE